MYVKEDDLPKKTFSPQPVQTLLTSLRLQYLFPWSGTSINAGTGTNYITWIRIFFTYLIITLWDIVERLVVADQCNMFILQNLTLKKIKSTPIFQKGVLEYDNFYIFFPGILLKGWYLPFGTRSVINTDC